LQRDAFLITQQMATKTHTPQATNLQLHFVLKLKLQCILWCY